MAMASKPLPPPAPGTRTPAPSPRLKTSRAAAKAIASVRFVSLIACTITRLPVRLEPLPSTVRPVAVAIPFSKRSVPFPPPAIPGKFADSVSGGEVAPGDPVYGVPFRNTKAEVPAAVCPATVGVRATVRSSSTERPLMATISSAVPEELKRSVSMVRTFSARDPAPSGPNRPAFNAPARMSRSP